MATGQTPAPDQLPDQPRNPSTRRSPIELGAQVVGVLGGLAFLVFKQHSALGTQNTLIVVVLALASLSQVFPRLQLFPKSSRAPLILNIFRGLCFVFVAGLIIPLFARPTPDPSPTPTPTPSIAESTLVGLNTRLEGLRGQYQTLLRSGNKVEEVNRQADLLAQNIRDISDEDLGLDMQIFKYESLAYAYGMIAGSETIGSDDFSSEDKLQAIKALLEDSEKAQKLIEEVRRPQPANARLQIIRAWLRNDDADARLQRLTAVGLCFRWQVSHNADDRSESRELVNTLPAYYKARERPQLSYELAPCVNDPQPKAPSSKAAVPSKHDR